MPLLALTGGCAQTQSNQRAQEETDQRIPQQNTKLPPNHAGLPVYRPASP